MNNFSSNIRPHVEIEFQAAKEAEANKHVGLGFAHLERAHVLGQASTVQHVRVHWRMLLWAARQGSLRECLGQLLRIGGAATKTAAGLVPYGNTGGSNVSPFKPMPIAPDLEMLIQRAYGSVQ
jgi:hypothetical protein